MKALHGMSLLGGTLLLIGQAVRADIAVDELLAPQLTRSAEHLHFLLPSSLSNRHYRLQYSETMAAGTWQDSGVVRSGGGGPLEILTPYESGFTQRFFRIALMEAPAAPDGFSLISAGSFQMGDALDAEAASLPTHPVHVSEFYMAKHMVSKALWDEVKAWATLNGYNDLMAGDSKAASHPVHSVTWWSMLKWCNARSQRDGLTPCYYTDVAQTEVFKNGNSNIASTMVKWTANGYRLPTEAEWEKAARGGLHGKRYPWGDLINHTYANYRSAQSPAYDAPPNQGYHPDYKVDGVPYTSPVESFMANGYGLYGMAGNVWQWCWDRYANSYYAASPTHDPRGDDLAEERVFRGGSWSYYAMHCRVAYRSFSTPGNCCNYLGFRLVRASIP